MFWSCQIKTIYFHSQLDPELLYRDKLLSCFNWAKVGATLTFMVEVSKANSFGGNLLPFLDSKVFSRKSSNHRKASHSNSIGNKYFA